MVSYVLSASVDDEVAGENVASLVFVYELQEVLSLGSSVNPVVSCWMFAVFASFCEEVGTVDGLCGWTVHTFMNAVVVTGTVAMVLAVVAVMAGVASCLQNAVVVVGATLVAGVATSAFTARSWANHWA